MPTLPRKPQLRKISFKIEEAQRGMRLDHALAELLPKELGEPLSKAKVRLLIVAGAAYLNGKRVRIASKTVLPGARVDVYVDLKKLHDKGPSKDKVFKMSESDILFEDEFVIVVNKPYGLPTQPTLDEARANLFALVRKYLSERDKIAQPYLGLHHRLDRDTSGVILFTKSTAANSGVAEMFSKHTAQKFYYALASKPAGRPEMGASWTVKNYLRKSSEGGKKTKILSVRSGGDFAQTEFRLKEEFGHALWLEAKPKTGRMHQIRVHLAEDGMPILGDATYGGDLAAAPRLMLHAVRLVFPHPVQGHEVTVESPLPQDFLAVIERMRK